MAKSRKAKLAEYHEKLARAASLLAERVREKMGKAPWISAFLDLRFSANGSAIEKTACCPSRHGRTLRVEFDAPAKAAFSVSDAWKLAEGLLRRHEIRSNLNRCSVLNTRMQEVADDLLRHAGQFAHECHDVCQQGSPVVGQTRLVHLALHVVVHVFHGVHLW